MIAVYRVAVGFSVSSGDDHRHRHGSFGGRGDLHALIDGLDPVFPDAGRHRRQDVVAEGRLHGEAEIPSDLHFLDARVDATQIDDAVGGGVVFGGGVLIIFHRGAAKDEPMFVPRLDAPVDAAAAVRRRRRLHHEPTLFHVEQFVEQRRLLGAAQLADRVGRLLTHRIDRLVDVAAA